MYRSIDMRLAAVSANGAAWVWELNLIYIEVSLFEDLLVFDRFGCDLDQCADFCQLGLQGREELHLASARGRNGAPHLTAAVVAAEDDGLEGCAHHFYAEKD